MGHQIQSVYRQVQFVSSHYSLYSSANNHLTGEAAGVYISTRTWPYWENFGKWGRGAKQYLVDAARDQTFPDGANREQAFWYVQFVLDFFILAGLAGRRTGDDFPDEYWEAIESMLEFIQSMIDAGGNLPMVGDADDGVVVRLSEEPNFCPFRSLLATGAILFDRSDFAVASGKMDDKTRILVGEDGFAELLQRGKVLKQRIKRSYSDAGYYLLGQNFGARDEIRMLVDSGHLGYLSIAAHGHADALAIWLSVSGREILIDPGTYRYNGDPDWRAWFRGTRAHNTITVDGEDQSVQGGTFLWTKHANSTCLKFDYSDKEDQFAGEHDGYMRLSDPVSHRREIRRCGAHFEVTDLLTCGKAHEVEQWWHFAEDCVVTVQGRDIRAESGGVDVTLSVESDDIHIFRGNDLPIAGWVSRRYDVKTATTSVRVRVNIDGSESIRTDIRCTPEVAQ